MTKVINLTPYLEASKPKVQIYEDTYEVNDEKTVVLKVQKLMENVTEEEGFKNMDKAFQLLLGDGYETLKEKHPSVVNNVSQITVLMTGIMSAISGEDMAENTAERFQGKKATS